MRIFFFTGVDVNDPSFGGAKGSKSRYEILKKLADVDIFILQKRSDLASMLSLLQGHYPPMRNVIEIVDKIRNGNYDIVFIDTSVCGELVKAIKEIIPTIPVFAYFQNCEYDWIDVRFLGKRTIKSTIYRSYVKKSEKNTAKYSDICAALSKRDCTRIEELYGIVPNVILPLFIRDEAEVDDFEYNQNKYALLFGPTEPANIEGFKWFIENVSPHINIKTVLAGKGFEKYKEELSSKKVDVIGYVDDIHELYKKAACVCIPLFNGGGMKIKTVEAMMFGKTIFGTDEAFAGYDVEYTHLGGLCNNAQEYIKKINSYLNEHKETFNKYSRHLYENVYSEKAALDSYKKLLKRLSNCIY